MNPSQLTSSQRRKLRALGHALKPVARVGKGGLTEPVAASVESGLLDHELIKIKFTDFKDQKEPILAQLAERCGAEIVGQVGHTALLYRPHPDPERRKIDPKRL